MIREFTIDDIAAIDSIGATIKEDFCNKNNIIERSKLNYVKIFLYEDVVIKGFVEIENHFEITDIINIAVDPDFQNKGIATKLIEYVINNTKSEKLMLEVNEINTKAINLYTKCHFKEITRRKKYYGSNDAIIMERKLPMKDVYILGIESSCDETSISIVKNGSIEIATTVLTQMDTHALYGGVVPEIASRMHTENITMVLEDLLNKANMQVNDVDAIAVTYAPGLLGSLLVGVEFAKVLSLVYDKPLIATHHIAGHIYANNLVKPLEYPLLALVVSGGHTELVLMEGDYKFKVLGTTKDDAIGESFDKVARVLGLPYPGGPNVEKYAKEGKPSYILPKPMDNDELNFSFSGLKSAVINLSHNEEQRGNEVRKYDLARSFQDTAFDQVIRKTRLAIERYNIERVIVAGGVSASAELRRQMQELCDELHVDLSIPPMKYCTDNATMIACAAYPQYLNKDFASLDLRAKSQEYFFQEK